MTDPLKHTPACELDRDNAVNRLPAKGFAWEAKELRAEIARLQQDKAEMARHLAWARTELDVALAIARKALEPKP